MALRLHKRSETSRFPGRGKAARRAEDKAFRTEKTLMRDLGMCSAHGREGDEDDGDLVPGTPWTPPEEPSPDGQTPEGEGKHRK